MYIYYASSISLKSVKVQPVKLGWRQGAYGKVAYMSFGLVNIPIKLYSAAEDKTFSFNQLCQRGHRIHNTSTGVVLLKT